MYIASAHSSGKVSIFDVEKNLSLERSFTVSDYPLTSIRYRGDFIVMTTSSDGKISTHHTSSGKRMHLIEDQNNPLLCMDLNPTQTLFATGGHQKVVKLYDDETKTLIRELHGDYNNVAHSNRIFSVNFHPTDHDLLASGGWDNIVVFYDIRKKTVIGNCLGPHICGDAIDMKGNYILTASWKNKQQIKIFDIRTYKLVEEIDWEYKTNDHTTYLYTAQFNKHADYFAVGGSNISQYRVFDSKNTNKFCYEEFDEGHSVFTLDFGSTINNYLALGKSDGLIELIEVKKK